MFFILILSSFCLCECPLPFGIGSTLSVIDFQIEFEPGRGVYIGMSFFNYEGIIPDIYVEGYSHANDSIHFAASDSYYDVLDENTCFRTIFSYIPLEVFLNATGVEKISYYMWDVVGVNVEGMLKVPFELEGEEFFASAFVQEGLSFNIQRGVDLICETNMELPDSHVSSMIVYSETGMSDSQLFLAMITLPPGEVFEYSFSSVSLTSLQAGEVVVLADGDDLLPNLPQSLLNIHFLAIRIFPQSCEGYLQELMDVSFEMQSDHLSEDGTRQTIENSFSFFASMPEVCDSSVTLGMKANLSCCGSGESCEELIYNEVRTFSWEILAQGRVEDVHYKRLSIISSSNAQELFRIVDSDERTEMGNELDFQVESFEVFEDEVHARGSFSLYFDGDAIDLYRTVYSSSLQSRFGIKATLYVDVDYGTINGESVLSSVPYEVRMIKEDDGIQTGVSTHHCIVETPPLNAYADLGEASSVQLGVVVVSFVMVLFFIFSS